jgi:predicted ribosome quality control (RQC) complex YloA/Tae2 family protein
MVLDFFTLSALVDELLDTVAGGRIQDVIDVDSDGIGLEIYAERHRHYLYLSADPMRPRLHLVPEKLRRGLVKPTPLGLVLRRYVEDGLLDHISQPPWERILQLEISGPQGPVTLVIEPMEKRGNLILVQAGNIIDCMRRVGPDENRYRLILPAHDYKLPPPQTGKLDPFRLTLDQLEHIFTQVDDPKRKTVQVLTAHLLGVSPLLAKEIIHRSGADLNQKAAVAQPGALFKALPEVIEPLRRRDWQPGVVETDGRTEAFSVYPITHVPGWHPVETLSAAMSAYYGAPVGDDAYDAAKIPVREALQEALVKLRARVASLERGLVDDSDRERIRQSGELILAYQYTFQPGQTELNAQYEVDGPELLIRLDPALSPLENAQAYFTRYDKAKRALDDVPRLLAENQQELQFVEQLGADLEFARSWPEIDEVQQALQQRGHWQGKPQKRIAGSGASAPLRIVTEGDYVIWVGRNSRQNEQVTFGKGSPQDLWFHAHDVPGAHVVLKFDGRPLPEAAKEQAAALAAYYSAKRTDGRVVVDYTRCLNVRKIKGAAPGMVTYKSEGTYTVAPRSEKEPHPKD